MLGGWHPSPGADLWLSVTTARVRVRIGVGVRVGVRVIPRWANKRNRRVHTREVMVRVRVRARSGFALGEYRGGSAAAIGPLKPRVGLGYKVWFWV